MYSANKVLHSQVLIILEKCLGSTVDKDLIKILRFHKTRHESWKFHLLLAECQVITNLLQINISTERAAKLGTQFFNDKNITVKRKILFAYSIGFNLHVKDVLLFTI